MERNLYLLVEGIDDFRFFEKVGSILFTRTQSFPVEYSQKSNQQINKIISGYRNSPYDNYIYFADQDNHKTIHVVKKARKKIITELNEDNICVVSPEIESWYLAGLNEKDSITLGIKYLPTTDSVTKERFHKIVPSRVFEDYFRKEHYMDQILNLFSVDLARRRNASFNEFYKQYIL